MEPNNCEIGGDTAGLTANHTHCAVIHLDWWRFLNPAEDVGGTVWGSSTAAIRAYQEIAGNSSVNFVGQYAAYANNGG